MNLNKKTDVNHNIGFYTELKEKTNEKRTNNLNTGAFKLYKNHSTKIETNQPNLHFGKPPKIKTIITTSLKLKRLAFPLRQIVCDVCCAPLYIYSENFIAAYLDPRAELPPSLCDIHISELEAEVTT